MAAIPSAASLAACERAVETVEDMRFFCTRLLGLFRKHGDW